jgi:large subunit ribosomal protein L4
MRRLAIRSALSDKVANEKLIVLNELTFETPRTKDMVSFLDKLPLDGKRVLMMLPQRNENVVLSLRNIPFAKVQHVSSINVVELLKHDCLIMPVKTVRWLEMVFGEGLSAEEASARIRDEELDGKASESEATEDEELGESASESEATEDEELGESASESARADSEEA